MNPKLLRKTESGVIPGSSFLIWAGLVLFAFSTEKRPGKFVWPSPLLQEPLAPSRRTRCPSDAAVRAAEGILLEPPKMRELIVVYNRQLWTAGIEPSRPAACGGALDGRCVPPVQKAKKKTSRLFSVEKTGNPKMSGCSQGSPPED